MYIHYNIPLFSLFYFIFSFYYFVNGQSTIPCNNNGLLYPDDPYCECFQCFQGLNCSKEINECIINDFGGNPLLFQEYWEQIPTEGEAVILSSYRNGYQISNNFWPPIGKDKNKLNGISTELRDAILGVHNIAKNVDISDHYIVLGSGCTELYTGAAWALHRRSNKAKLNLFAQTPYYPGYEKWGSLHPFTTPFNSSIYQNPQDIIEYVTHPNNPNGEQREPFYSTSPNIIYDMIYNWPSLTNHTTHLANYDIMLFSMSKLTGNAATRIGWGFFKDPKVAELMAEYISAAQIQISIDAQYRTLKLLQHIVKTKGAIFNWIRNKMKQRWEVINMLFDPNKQTRFTQLAVPGQFYAWIRCNEDVNCKDVFKKEAGIITWEGSAFGAPHGKYVRLELVQRTSTWNIFKKRLEKMIYVKK